MWKLLSSVVLSSSIAVAVAAAPEQTSQTTAHSEHQRCVERGFKTGTPQLHRCINQRLSMQHRRAPVAGPLPTLPAPSRYETPPRDRTPYDPNRLTTTELQQATVGPPPAPDIMVQAPRTSTIKQYQAGEQLELQREADARRQALVDQSNEMIRSDTGL
jgi:hypothetical protein